MARDKVGNRGRTVAFLIICEGKNTEKTYFDNVNDILDCVVAKYQFDKDFGSFKGALDKFGNLKEVEVYVVGDVDGRDESFYKNVVKILKENFGDDERLIISNPCFELWLLYHFEYLTRALSCYNEVTKDKSFQKCFPKYTKNYKFKFEKQHLETAVENAKQSCEHAKQMCENGNYLFGKNASCTNVYKIVEKMLSVATNN